MQQDGSLMEFQRQNASYQNELLVRTTEAYMCDLVYFQGMGWSQVTFSLCLSISKTRILPLVRKPLIGRKLFNFQSQNRPFSYFCPIKVLSAGKKTEQIQPTVCMASLQPLECRDHAVSGLSSQPSSFASFKCHLCYQDHQLLIRPWSYSNF